MYNNTTIQLDWKPVEVPIRALKVYFYTQQSWKKYKNENNQICFVMPIQACVVCPTNHGDIADRSQSRSQKTNSQKLYSNIITQISLSRFVEFHLKTVLQYCRLKWTQVRGLPYSLDSIPWSRRWCKCPWNNGTMEQWRSKLREHAEGWWNKCDRSWGCRLRGDGHLLPAIDGPILYEVVHLRLTWYLLFYLFFWLLTLYQMTRMSEVNCNKWFLYCIDSLE